MIAKLSQKELKTNKYDKKGRPLNLLEWAELIEDKDYSRIKQQWTPGRKYFISTVWLGLDYNFNGTGDPIIFETMVFGNKQSLDQERYGTVAEAKTGHKKLYDFYQQLDKAD